MGFVHSERQYPSCLTKVPLGEGTNEEEDEEEAGVAEDEDDAEEGEEEDEAAAPVLFHGEPELCLTPHPTERPTPPAPA